MPPTLHSIEHRGCKFAYSIWGDGPPVLLIQGVGVHGDGWSPQVDDLANGYRCLTFDNRGMGLSQPAAVPVSVEQMAEDARVIMDAEGWESAHVVGHSLGGLIALHLALSARNRVRSLSLLSTFSGGRYAARPTPWMICVGAQTQIGTRRMRRRAFLRLVMPRSALAGIDRDALAERLAPLFGHDLADQPPIVSQQLKALRAYDATPRLGELAGLPTLVVSAQYDPIASPRAGQILASGIPRAKYVEVPDASHGLPIHRPETVNVLLREHLTD